MLPRGSHGGKAPPSRCLALLVIAGVVTGGFSRCAWDEGPAGRDRVAPVRDAPRGRPDPPSWSRARDAFARGDWEDAVVAARQVLDADPRHVRAHRVLQESLDRLCRRGEAILEARARFRDAPGDPLAIYLHARLIRDPQRALPLFRRCTRIAPQFFWGWLGSGVTLAKLGRGDEALTCLHRARLLDPEALEVPRVTAWIAGTLGDARLEIRSLRRLRALEPRDARAARDLAAALHREDDAAGALAQAIEAVRLDPRSPSSRDTLLWLLETERAAGGAKAPAGNETLEEIRGLFDASPGTEVARAWLAEQRGDLDEAYRLYGDAFAAGERGWPLERLRRLALIHGSGELAWKVHAARVGEARLVDPSQDRGGVQARLRDLLAGAPEGWRSLAGVDLLEQNGWMREARDLAETLASQGIPGASDAAARLGRWTEALRGIREEILDPSSLRQSSLPAVMRRVVALLEPATGPLRAEVESHAPVGSFVGPGDLRDARGEDPLVSRGIFFLAGQHFGEPVQARLAPLLASWSRGVPGDREVPASCWGIAGEPKEPSGNRPAASFLGLTVGSRIILDLDRIASIERTDAPPRAIPAEDALPARTTGERRDVDEPLCVAARLRERAARHERVGREGVPPARGTGGDPPLSRVLDHEIGHLQDSLDYLPLLRHPLRGLGLALRNGLSPASIQADLERRAQLRALACTSDPFRVLAETVDGMLDDRPRSPYREGYRRLLASLVRAIDDEGPRDLGLDPARNLLQQLDRLAGEDIRRLARGLARGEGLALPSFGERPEAPAGRGSLRGPRPGRR